MSEVTSPEVTVAAPPPAAPPANGGGPAPSGRHIPSLAEIEAASDIVTEDVPVPEWGGPGAVIPIRGLTGAERDSYEASITDVKGATQKLRLENSRAKLVVLAAVDDSGQRLFTKQAIEVLTKKSAAPLERLFDAARRLSGMTESDVAELEEQLGKGPSA